MKYQAVIALGATLLLSALGERSAPVQAAPPVLSAADKRQAAEESKEGAEAAAQIAKQCKFVQDKAVTDRINTIGQKLAVIANSGLVPSDPATGGYGNTRVYPFEWHFSVIDSKDVNAFSLPGGYVYVYSGLLKDIHTDDELAGVLGHEITHAAHHHLAALAHEQSKMSSQMFVGLIAAILAKMNPSDIVNLSAGASYYQQGVLNTKYSQAAERDADYGGTLLMQKAGYNPVGMLTFMERLADTERRGPNIDYGIFRDHPYTQERVGNIETHLTAMEVPVTPRVIRQVAGASRATSQANPNHTASVLYNGKTIATLADPDGKRAAAAADALNAQLDGGLQMYQVRTESGAVIAADRPVLTLTPADIALTPGATADSLAKASANALKAGLWAQTIAGNTP